MNFNEKAKSFIAIDTSDVRGMMQAFDFLKKEYSSPYLNFTFQNFSTGEDSVFGLVVQCKNLKNTDQSFLLVNNIDTTYREDVGLWTKTGANPLNLTVDGDCLYGLGVAQSKLDTLLKLDCLLEEINERNKNEVLPFVFIITGRQFGSRKFVKNFVKKETRIVDGALIGEPTNLKFVTSTAGMVKVEITINFSDEEVNYRNHLNAQESISTHEKVFTSESRIAFSHNYNDNSIENLLKYLSKLPDRTVILKIDGGRASHVNAPNASLEVDIDAKISGDLMANKLVKFYDFFKEINLEFNKLQSEIMNSKEISYLNIGTVTTYNDCIRFTGSVRLHPMLSFSKFESFFNIVKSKFKQEGFIFRVLDLSFPYSLDSNIRKENFFKKMNTNLDIQNHISLTNNEANVTGQLKIPTIVFGPGQLEDNCEAANESINIKDLEKASSIYRKIFKGYKS